MRLKFLLNEQYEAKTISSYKFFILGDEALFLGGSTVENGCIIGARSVVPPNFKSEAYGIYAGSPARLIKFRFSEKVCQALSDLAWWELPLA